MLLKRVIRRIKYFPIFLFEARRWEYESCERCGSAFRVMWDVDDSIWAKVMNRNDGGGCVCVDCFVKIAEARNIIIKPNSIKLSLFYPLGDDDK